jgi:putative membrane protein
VLFAPLLHGGHLVGPGAWHPEPTVIGGAFIVAGLYFYALSRADERLEWWRTACFFAGTAAMFLALVSPLDVAADYLLSMHMLQHVVLTTIGPPLVLLGLTPELLRPVLGARWLASSLRMVTQAPVAGSLFIVNMWLWHVPPVYELALDHLGVHIAMHIAFMATGLLFWWPVVQPLPQLGRIGEGARLLYLFVTGFPMGLLALLLLSSGNVIYDYYERVPTRLWGIGPLADQQVAGFFRFLDREGQPEALPRPGPADAG